MNRIGGARVGMRKRLLVAAGSVFAVVVVATPRTQASKIPLRGVRVTATSDSITLGNTRDIRAVGGERVFVNDIGRRQLLWFSSDLQSSRTVVGEAGAFRYGPVPAKLLAYTGDSSVFVDLEASALVILSGDGRAVRTVSPPKPADLRYLLRYSQSGGYDPGGSLIYQVDRGAPQGERGTAPVARPAPDAGISYYRDSGAVLRGGFETRAVDTLTYLRRPTRKVVTTVREDGQRTSVTAFNPVSELDDWTLLPDGTVAVVRAQDYHVDWISRDGRVRSTPKMPIDWLPLNVGDKQRMIDSLREEILEATMASSAQRPTSGLPVITMVEPTDLPDYYPSIRSGQVKSDPNGNVWIAPNTSTVTGGGPVWDVVNRDGVIVERVQLPVGRRLVGFGFDGTLYLVCKTATGERLERASVVR